MRERKIIIHAPSRYVRFVRVFIPLAAFCGLVYLFLITFLPEHFAPVTTKTNHGARAPPGPLVVPVLAAVQDENQALIDDTSAFEQRHDIIEKTAIATNLQTDSQFPSNQPHKGSPGSTIPHEEERGDNYINESNKDKNAGSDSDSRLRKVQGWQQDENSEYNFQPKALGDSSGSHRMGREASSLKAEIPFWKHDRPSDVKRANGVLVILTREEEVQATREIVRQIEDRFNLHRHYPWIVLSPIPLTEGSIARIKRLSKGAGMTFGTIPREQWRLPKWIEAAKVLQGDHEKMKLGLDRTALETRHRWRYMSGFLARHPLLDGYEFLWRVEPGMEVFCDLADDPMLAMEKSGHLFAWSLSETVRDAGVPGAWSLIKRFKETHPDLVPKANDEAFLKREEGDVYTGCTYGVQNSIARVDFLRSPEYLAYFTFVDRHGPIYYEKWTDATVMTIGLSLLAPRNATVHFEQNGWSFGGQSYCPSTLELNRHCHCDPTPSASALHMSCTDFWAGLGPSPRRKERVECNKEGKCVVYISKAT
ncbi:unnamed protein product [Mortierella alpina]